MKILILANSGQFLLLFKRELISALHRKGHEVTVVSPLGELRAQVEAAGCRAIEAAVNRRGTNPFKDLALCRKYKKIIAAEKPDRVITYTVKPNIWGGLAAKKRGVRYYASVTGAGTGFQKPLIRILLKFLYRRALKKAEKVFFENAENLKTFVELKLVKKERAVLVSGSGVNLERFKFLPLEKSEKTKFLFFGRVMKEKGIEEFLYAAKKAREEGLNAEFSVLGGLEENYKKTLDKLCADGTIVYHGFQKNVAEFLAACHAAVLPSYHEGMSNALLEAAATGRPLITSNVAGCAEAVVDGVSGYLAEVRSGEDLYQKIKAFAALSAEEKRAMGRASREHIEKNFDRERVNAQVIAQIEGEQE